MKIIFVGDLFLGGDLSGKKLKDCIRIDKFHQADYRIVNLEHPISDSEDIAEKSSLFTGSDVLPSLKESGINAVCLANNHIHDKLNDGINSTINHLDDIGVKYFGAGVDIVNARKPLWITDSLCVLGYCQHNSPTLNKIQLADETTPGVAPLNLSIIEQDLNSLPRGAKAILYLHWGREHVWLTQSKNIDLASHLLRNDKVALIVGTHPHRIQGYLTFTKKRAYFSLGNFLFPNFLLKPKTEVVNNCFDKTQYKGVDVSRQYHSVSKLTYKKWRFVNRVSLLVEFDTDSLAVSHRLIYQDDNEPIVKELKGYKKYFFIAIIAYLNILYQIPSLFYKTLEKISSYFRFKIWRYQILLFKVKQIGILASFKKALLK